MDGISNLTGNQSIFIEFNGLSLKSLIQIVTNFYIFKFVM